MLTIYVQSCFCTHQQFLLIYHYIFQEYFFPHPVLLPPVPTPICTAYYKTILIIIYGIIKLKIKFRMRSLLHQVFVVLIKQYNFIYIIRCTGKNDVQWVGHLSKQQLLVLYLQLHILKHWWRLCRPVSLQYHHMH